MDMKKNKITQITRKAIFDEMKDSDFNYITYEMDEIKFWNRIYVLKELPSMDSQFDDMEGDLWQHRVNNPDDWDDYWFLSDERINMMTCKDDVFLGFLSETIHPLVRSNQKEVISLVQLYNWNLKEDGYEISTIRTVSGRAIYGGRTITGGKFTKEALAIMSEKVNFLDSEYLNKQIDLMRIHSHLNPEQAIGLSKEIIESFCKALLDVSQAKDLDKIGFSELLMRANKILKLVPKGVSKEKRGSEIIRGILGGIIDISLKMNELRNLYGSGHGKSKTYKGLTERHATLVTNLTSSLLIFWIETYELQKDR